MAAEEEGRFVSAVDEVMRLKEQGSLTTALEVVRTARAALADDARVAVLHYCEGRVLDALERFDEAKEAYERARDFDLLPTRGTGGLNEALRSLAKECRGVFLADVVKEFEAAVPDGIPDQRLFFDNCHPNVRGHRLIARKILDVVLENNLVK